VVQWAVTEELQLTSGLNQAEIVGVGLKVRATEQSMSEVNQEEMVAAAIEGRREVRAKEEKVTAKMALARKVLAARGGQWAFEVVCAEETVGPEGGYKEGEVTLVMAAELLEAETDPEEVAVAHLVDE